MKVGWRRGSSAAQAYRQVPAPSPPTPWRAADWCAVDLELTGLDPRRDEIIAIGAVPIQEGRVVLGRAHYSLVRPGTAPGRASILIHKLRSADLADAPSLSEAIDELLAVMAGTVPVFHTAWVEQAFLGRALRRRGVRLVAAADTEVLGRRWLTGRDEVSPAHLGLADLAQRLGMPAETPHHALGDALTTAKAFIALAALLGGPAPQTVGSLIADDVLAPRRAPGGARRLGPGG